MDKEKAYIFWRIAKGKAQGVFFYICRLFPINKKKIVFCCIEGSTGYSCNPKYIAEELIRKKRDYELVWLVNDTSKKFPKEIKAVENTLLNRAYHLSTARVWIDNSRKQLECRKRKGQIYLQTWHAKLGFKPTCLDRGKSFPEIARLVSRHDSGMIDYVLSNSQWYDDTLPTGMMYNGPTLRFGSPRCDVLVNRDAKLYRKVRETYKLPGDSKIIMYAPTYRGGSQRTKRVIQADGGRIHYEGLLNALEGRFGGEWHVMLRMHPQLTARGIGGGRDNSRVIDVSKADDMYEILVGCDAFLTDYSSAAFDAAVMGIPVFLYCDDYGEYQKEEGKLLWKLEELPFKAALDNEGLREAISSFDYEEYKKKLADFFEALNILEDGKASERVDEFLYGKMS